MQYSKASLAKELSHVIGFSNPKFLAEQYQTPSEIAATVLWHAKMDRKLKGKTVADLGCGTGILGIGALLLGAKNVYFVEKDPEAVKVLKENMEIFQVRGAVFEMDVSLFREHADLVLQNPPFGTKEKHADRIFLEKAFEISENVYSFHKSGTRAFVKALAADRGFTINEELAFDFPLPSTMKFHDKKVKHVEVSCFVLEKHKP